MPQHEVEITQVTLDVALATELLGVNVANRPMKQNATRKYAEEMLSGRWQFNGDPLRVDTSGRLIDGQNRCQAVLLANELSKNGPVSVPAVLIRGLAPESQDSMDIGKPRTVADQLAMRGAAYYATTAAMCRLLVIAGDGGLVGESTPHPAHSRVIAFYDEHREEVDSVMSATLMYGDSSGTTASARAAARYLIEEKCADGSAVEVFFAGLSTGADLPEGSPILALRNRMGQAKQKRETVRNVMALLLILRAWNAHRTGQSLKQIPIRTAGGIKGVREIAA